MVDSSTLQYVNKEQKADLDNVISKLQAHDIQVTIERGLVKVYRFDKIFFNLYAKKQIFAGRRSHKDIAELLKLLFRL